MILNFLRHITRQIVAGKKERRLAPWEHERKTFENEARKQFLKLQEKGLPIPIMTL